MSLLIHPGLFSPRPRLSPGRSLQMLLLSAGLWFGSTGVMAMEELPPLGTQQLFAQNFAQNINVQNQNVLAQDVLAQDVLAQDVLSQDVLAQGVLAQQLLADLPSSSNPLTSQTPVDESIRIYIQQGRKFLDRQDYAEAIAQYEQALGRNPAIPEAWYGRMVAKKALGQPKEAVYSYYAYAEASRIVGDFEAALTGFDWFLQRQPKFLEASLGKAMALEEMGELAAAGQVYERAIATDPTDHRAWEFQGDMLARAEQYEAAAVSYQRWAELEPDNPEALWSYGQVLVELERYREALEPYKQLAVLVPEEAEPRQRQGWLWLQLGQFRQSVAQYEAAIARNPKSAASWQGKGYALAQLHRYDAAIEAMDQAVRLDPKDIWSWQQRADILEMLGRSQEAKDSLRQVDILRGVEVLSQGS